MYERTSTTQHKAVSRILSGSKREFEDEMGGEPQPKKPKVSPRVSLSKENDEKPMYVQNCVEDVYPKSALKSFQPVQNNVYNSSPDYDAEIADFFAKIAHLIL